MGAGQPADAGPTTDESAAQQGNLNPVTDAVEPAAPAALPPVEQRREVDAQFAASLRAAMGQGDDENNDGGAAWAAPLPGEARKPSAVATAAPKRGERFESGWPDAGSKPAPVDQLHPADLAATRRAVHAPPEPAPLAFRAARFSDGSLATERDGMVVAVYSAAEVDTIQKLLGART
jgi:hypothetical protein